MPQAGNYSPPKWGWLWWEEDCQLTRQHPHDIIMTQQCHNKGSTAVTGRAAQHHRTTGQKVSKGRANRPGNTDHHTPLTFAPARHPQRDLNTRRKTRKARWRHRGVTTNHRAPTGAERGSWGAGGLLATHRGVRRRRGGKTTTVPSGVSPHLHRTATRTVKEARQPTNRATPARHHYALQCHNEGTATATGRVAMTYTGNRGQQTKFDDINMEPHRRRAGPRDRSP